MRIFSLLPLIVLLSGCVSPSRTSRWVVTYYDRNHDGIVDFELHRLTNSADADWALIDTKFRGRYDLRIRWGYAVLRERIDLPVPRHVSITPGKPPISYPE